MSRLLIDTCLDVNNIPLNYTDVYAVTIPGGQIIKANVTIPIQYLYLEIGDTAALSLFNIKLNNPMPDIVDNQTATDIEHNISDIVIKEDMVLGFAKQLHHSLTSIINCDGYSQLQYMPIDASGARPVSGIGKAVVRILQHLFFKYILSNNLTTAEINASLNGMVLNEETNITNMFINNETNIRTFIEGRNTIYDSSDNAFYNYIDELQPSDTSENANIANRITAHILDASKDVSGSFTSLKLKNAIASFLYQSIDTKLHDRSYITGTDVLYPVKFEIGDKLYFTIDLNSASLNTEGSDNVATSKLPTQSNLDSLSSMGASRIYFEITVGDALIGNVQVPVTLHITSLKYTGYAIMTTAQQDSFKSALILGLSQSLGISSNLITIGEISDGSIVIQIIIKEFNTQSAGGTNAATAQSAVAAANNFKSKIESGELSLDTLKSTLAAMPESVKSALVAPGTDLNSITTALIAPPESGDIIWATHIGGNKTDAGVRTISDASGNIYVLGHYNSNPLSVYSPTEDASSASVVLPNTYGDQPHDEWLRISAYLIKYNKNGQHIWSNIISEKNHNTGMAIKGIDMTSDISGNIYILCSGGTSGVFNIYKKNTTNLATTNTIDIAASDSTVGSILIKYTPDGEYVFHCTLGLTFSTALRVNNDGLIYILGTINRYVQFNIKDSASPPNTTVLTSRNDISNPGAVMVVIDNAGKYKKVIYYISEYAWPVISYYMNIDTTDNVYIVVRTFGYNGMGYAFLVKYNKLDIIVYVKKIDVNTLFYAFNKMITTDLSNNLYMSIYAGQDLTTIETISNSTITFASPAGSYLIKFDPSGTFIWATRTEAHISPYTLICDTSNNIYSVGVALHGFTAYSPTNVSAIVKTIPRINPTGQWDNDAVICKYNSDGICIWATSLGGSGDDVAYGVSVYNDYVYVVGTYTTTPLKLYSSSKLINSASIPTVTLPSTGGMDTFIVKYKA